VKKILLTGASGFLGQHIFSVLNAHHQCFTLGRKKTNAQKHYLTSLPLNSDFQFDEQFDIVIHNAGKVHIVPKTKAERDDFFTINLSGTTSLLSKLTTNKPSVFVFISTVAVYGVKNGLSITESYPLNATDPYGKSKIEAENAVIKWGNENNIKTIILRLPLVYGEHITGNLLSMLKGLQKGCYFQLNKGKALRSVVNATDIANLLLRLEEIPSGIYNLTSSYDPTFAEIANTLSEEFKTGKAKNLPYMLAYPLALVGSILGFLIKKELPFNLKKLHMMSEDLTFSSEKAKQDFNWNPKSWKGYQSN